MVNLGKDFLDWLAQSGSSSKESEYIEKNKAGFVAM